MREQTELEVAVAKAICDAPWKVGQGYEIAIDMARAAIHTVNAWNHRTLPSAPAVEGVERELVERLEAAIAEAEFGHESPTHVRALVAHLKTATSAISSLQRLVDGIDDERRGALDLCIERNKQIQALEKDVARLTALLAEADQVVKPFSKGPVWDHIDDDAPLTRTAEHGVRISAGHLRAARRYQQKREAK